MNDVLLYIRNFAYSQECTLYSKNKTVFRKIHQIFPVAGLFFLLTNCWQPAAGTDVHFFSYN